MVRRKASTSKTTENRHGPGGMDKTPRDRSTYVESVEGAQALSNTLPRTSGIRRRSIVSQCGAEGTGPKSDNRQGFSRLLRSVPNGLTAYLDMLHHSDDESRRPSCCSSGRPRKSSLKSRSARESRVPLAMDYRARIMRAALKGSSDYWTENVVLGHVPDSVIRSTISAMRQAPSGRTSKMLNKDPRSPSALSPSPQPRSTEWLRENLLPRTHHFTEPRQQSRITFRNTKSKTASGEAQHRMATSPPNRSTYTLPGTLPKPRATFPTGMSLNRSTKSSSSLPASFRPATAPTHLPWTQSTIPLTNKEAWLHQTLLVDGTLAGVPTSHASTSNSLQRVLSLRPSIVNSPLFPGPARPGAVFRTIIMPAGLYTPCHSMTRPSGNLRSSTVPGQLHLGEGSMDRRSTLSHAGSSKIDNLFSTKFGGHRESCSNTDNSDAGSSHIRAMQSQVQFAVPLGPEDGFRAVAAPVRRRRSRMKSHRYVRISDAGIKDTQSDEDRSAFNAPDMLPADSPEDSCILDFLTVEGDEVEQQQQKQREQQQQQQQQQPQQAMEGARREDTIGNKDEDTDSESSLTGPPNREHKSFLAAIAKGGPVAALQKELNKMRKEERKRRIRRPSYTEPVALEPYDPLWYL